MNPSDPNLAKVELIAAALGALCDELVFVGGCAAGLLIQDDTTADRVALVMARLESIAALANA